ncbi:MAG TPA: hypothetical protein VFB62_01590 [Polyangiaceae bacterium]|nr:hypothetical protein [Polyangiaceae bacterium]
MLTGGKGFAGAIASVLVGQVGADGTIASWAPGPDLPVGRYHAAGVVHDRFIYSIGGIDENEAHIADVVRLEIDESGAPGQWLAQTPLPDARTHLSAFVAGGFVYVVGGIMSHTSGDMFFKDTLRAPLGADGTLGAWESVGQPLAHELATAAPAVHCDHAYLFGGLVLLSPTNEILRAPLGADGSIGAWELLGVQLPLARSTCTTHPSTETPSTRSAAHSWAYNPRTPSTSAPSSSLRVWPATSWQASPRGAVKG